MFEPRRETIAVSELRLRDDLDPLAGPVEGQSSAGRPVGAITLPAHSYTEIEFAVRATVDARWGERYAFRLLDGADVIAGAPPAELVMGGKPAVDLSPGQRKGKPTKDPVPRYRLDPSIGLTDMSIAQAPVAASAAQFNLRGPVAAPIASRPARRRPTSRAGWPRTRAPGATPPTPRRGRCSSSSPIRSPGPASPATMGPAR